MKILFGALLAIAGGMMMGCGVGEPSREDAVVRDTANYFSMDGFFQSQIEYVDLRDFPIWYYRIENGVEDSTRIDKDLFRQWAQVFLDRSFKPEERILYKETMFQDLSTDSYTLNYSPVNAEDVTVRNVDILLSQETNQPKRVFIRSVYSVGDTTIEEQCNWKADKSFQVNRVKTIGGQQITELNTIAWNDK